jgi:hypothetical protein
MKGIISNSETSIYFLKKYHLIPVSTGSQHQNSSDVLKLPVNELSTYQQIIMKAIKQTLENFRSIVTQLNVATLHVPLTSENYYYIHITLGREN